MGRKAGVPVAFRDRKEPTHVRDTLCRSFSQFLLLTEAARLRLMDHGRLWCVVMAQGLERKRRNSECAVYGQ